MQIIPNPRQLSTYTAQPLSPASVENKAKNVPFFSPQELAYLRELFSLYDSLYGLCEELDKLDYLMKQEHIKHIYRGDKGPI
jgi:hypothetical protein